MDRLPISVCMALNLFLSVVLWATPLWAEAQSDNVEYGTVLAPDSAEEGVSLDPDTGDYIVIYKTTNVANQEVLIRLIIEPSTKIDPEVKSKFKGLADGTISYRYKIRNGRKAKQALEAIRLIGTSARPESLLTPSHWKGYVMPDQVYGVVRINWRFIGNGRITGLMPNRIQDGFGYNSADLPGIGEMRLKGAVDKVVAFAGEGPDPQSNVGKELNQIRAEDFIPRPAAVPKIPVPDPFDAAAVLTSLKQHLEEDLVPMKLVDPVFAAQLSRLLEAAIDAARRGNTVALRGHLKALRQSLKGFGEPDEEDHRAPGKEDDDEHLPETEYGTRAWPHPIAKLAARVLDFDLKYIEGRLSAD